MKTKKNKYYRVFDHRRGIYFATGYNAKSMIELIDSFKSYIITANEIDDSEENIDGFLSTWSGIAEYLQDVTLESSLVKFEEENIW